MRAKIRHPVVWPRRLGSEGVGVADRRVTLQHVGKSDIRIGRLGLPDVRLQKVEPGAAHIAGIVPGGIWPVEQMLRNLVMAAVVARTSVIDTESDKV